MKRRSMIISSVAAISSAATATADAAIFSHRRRRRVTCSPANEPNIGPAVNKYLYINDENGSPPCTAIFKLIVNDENEFPPHAVHQGTHPKAQVWLHFAPQSGGEEMERQMMWFKEEQGSSTTSHFYSYSFAVDMLDGDYDFWVTANYFVPLPANTIKHPKTVDCGT